MHICSKCDALMVAKAVYSNQDHNFSDILLELLRNLRVVRMEKLAGASKIFSKNETSHISKYKNVARCAKFSPDGKFVATGSADISIKLFEVAKIKQTMLPDTREGSVRPVIRTFYDHLQVLPESPDLPVYECGGCGTILQAKNQKRDSIDTGSLVHEADPTQKNGLDYLMSPSTDESDLGKILQRFGSGVGCRKEGIGDLNQSGKSHSSDVISWNENTGSSPEASGHAGAREDDFPLVQYGTMYHNELGNDVIELPGGISAADNILSSPKLNSHEDKSLVHGPGNRSPRKEDESRHSSESISHGSQIYSQNCMKELPTSTGFSEDLSSCYESCEDGDLSSVSGTDREMDVSLKNHLISKNLAAVSFPLANPEDQIRKAQSSSVANGLPDNQMFPLLEPTKH